MRIAKALRVLAMAALGVAGPSTAQAGPVHLVLQTRADRGAGSELFLADFTSLASFLASGSGGEGGQFLGINIAPDYNVAGFDIYQGVPYLLLETRVDGNAGTELFLADFASLDSFLASGPGGEDGQFLGINIAPHYDVAGFDIYQGIPYLLLETRVDGDAGSELFLADFASLASFLASGSGGEGGQFLGINIAPDYNVAGFDIFGGIPYLLLETAADGDAGSELFLADFASLASLLASGPGGEGGQFLGINIAGDYRVAGFDILEDDNGGGGGVVDPVPGVPEPGSLALILGGLSAIGIKRSRMVAKRRGEDRVA